MAYKLYLDKPTTFECEVAVKNASLKGAFARIILESGDMNFVFNGEIKNERCIVPIKKLKGLLEENTSGKISLEVVVEDTYFKPWEDSYLTETNKAVKVKIQEQVESSFKPTVNVKVESPKKYNLSEAVSELLYICKKLGITKETVISNKRKQFKTMLNEYFKATPDIVDSKSECIKKTLSRLN